MKTIFVLPPTAASPILDLIGTFNPESYTLRRSRSISVVMSGISRVEIES